MAAAAAAPTKKRSANTASLSTQHRRDPKKGILKTGEWTGNAAELLRMAMCCIDREDKSEANMARTELICELRKKLEDIVSEEPEFQHMMDMLNSADPDVRETLMDQITDRKPKRSKRPVSWGGNSLTEITNTRPPLILINRLKEATEEAKSSANSKQTQNSNDGLSLIATAAVTTSAASAAAATAVSATSIPRKLTSVTSKQMASLIVQVKYPPLVRHQDATNSKMLFFNNEYKDVWRLYPEHIEWLWMIFCAEYHLVQGGLSDSLVPWGYHPTTRARVQSRINVLNQLASHIPRDNHARNIKVFTLAAQRAITGKPLIPRKKEEYTGQARKSDQPLHVEYYNEMEARAYSRYTQKPNNPIPDHIYMYKALHPSDHSEFTDDEEEENFQKRSQQS